MADSEATNLALEIKGERWVSYPPRLRFPRSFATIYPFRGRGVVSRVLYWLHKVGIDKLILKSVVPPTIAKQFGFDVAFFWPSRMRSKSRFYGYGVNDGKVVEYIKFAMGEAECLTLDREATNTISAGEISNNLFHVPKVLGVESAGDILAVRFQPIPEDAHVCQLSDDWLARVRDARRQIENAGYMHGDFAWHNFKAAGEKLWILDWEEMRKSENRLVDEICLECGLAYYWQHKPIEQVMEMFRSKYGCKASTRMMAKEAVDDLARRKITMGDVLKKRLDAEGWR